MWPRTVELMLGCWLLMSPFVFGHDASDAYRWAVDLGGGALVAVFALLSFWESTKRAHAGVFVVGAGLAALAYADAAPLPPALQNHILVGLLLMMMAIIPSEATLPPEAWSRYERESSRGNAPEPHQKGDAT